MKPLLESYNRMIDYVVGSPEKVDKPLKWHNWVFFIIKIAIPVCAVILFLYRKYNYALVFTFAFALDVANYFRIRHLYIVYKETERALKKLKLRR